MAGFRVHKSIVDLPCEKVTISSLAVTIGDLLELIPGEASTWTATTANSLNYSRKAIAMETVANTATSVLVQPLSGFELVAAESANDSAVADNGNLMVLSDVNTVNNSHTTSASEKACFLQTGTLGATTDKVILGHVMVGNSVDSDATA